MKTARLFTFLLVVLLQSCFIKILDHSAVDDGTSKLSNEEMKHISPFEIINYDKKISAQKGTLLNFEKINSQQVLEICNKHKFTLVKIWASWCSKCYASLPGLPALKDSLKNRSCTLVLIAQNINITAMSEYLIRYKYPVLSYVLDPNFYGTNETNKQIAFCKELAPNSNRGFSGAVPINLLLTQNKDCIYIKTGSIHISEIDSVIKSYN